MNNHITFVANTPLQHEQKPVEGSHVNIEGEPFYRITNFDMMCPFLMSMVSDSDHWLFISSNGALTAGRKDPDHALFPYYTDDRIHDEQDQTGSKTILRITQGMKSSLWEPFSPKYEGLYHISRNLYKSLYGNKIIFEEINQDLSVTFSYAWMASERFGFVRQATVINNNTDPITVELLDGIQNLLPYEIHRRFQLEFSTLADGYKENELDNETGLALFKLSSIPTDHAEPNEALRVTTVWSNGLTEAKRLLSSTQLDRFRQGLPIDEETYMRGRRGAYFIKTQLGLSPHASKTWHIVADVNQDAASVRAIRQLLKTNKNLQDTIVEDVKKGTKSLTRIVAGADGLQQTGDALNTWRHFSNTLFNVMRGGIPDRNYQIARSDLIAFIATANHTVYEKHANFLQSLPETILHQGLLDLAHNQQDPALERLMYEYLPLTFSRRHGDPSRPWNTFAIEVKDEHGGKILNYQGNWRDIFQNWEALAISFPGYLESMIFKFVDASTADGYNPYRIERNGFEWEVIFQDSPWSTIGYWGDHQVIYLLKLLEESSRYHPDALQSLLARRLFTYANVPYRIKPYEMLLQDPHHTIEFNADLDREIHKRVALLGSDGKFLLDKNDAPYLVNLAEKLLVTALAKLSNYVPEAGIWMNTQRPEWNDGNNALVGYGTSMVTLYYLHRFLAFCRQIFATADTRAFEISAEVAIWFEQIYDTLNQRLSILQNPITDRMRKDILDALGQAGSDYREKLYSTGFSGERITLTTEKIFAFCDVALQHIVHSIHANRKDDGLYHAYNLIKVVDDQAITIRHLYEMLEGQVAVLSSGVLSPKESLTLLDTLRKSRLYRADQNSYILYPDRQLPRFLEKNNIPASAIEKSPLLTTLLRNNDQTIIARDIDGITHFNAAFRNSSLLKKALSELQGELYQDLVAREGDQILELYEQVFDHQSFTGRSGTFYKYEGLGCIYWHMVSKLLLAIQEVLNLAVRSNAESDIIKQLWKHYDETREGIGVHKSPELYGAIPTDPYSHTPSFAGVQQPGMTGQVKEDIITRFGEMGVIVAKGKLGFNTQLVNRSEFLKAPSPFLYYTLDGEEQCIELEKDTLAFTLCQIPVIAHRAGLAQIKVAYRDGSNKIIAGLTLDLQTSTDIFKRSNEVLRLDVFFGLSE
jgi:hypothetical protein